jgi:hypothetical protein
VRPGSTRVARFLRTTNVRPGPPWPPRLSRASGSSPAQAVWSPAMGTADRVQERRRAAALARHYRDEEGLSVADIARRLGRAPATVRAYLYDPTGDKARAVKRRYQGVCRGCGAPTAARGGKGDAYEHCNCAVIPARSRRPGRGSGCATRCTRGGPGMAVRRRRRTGLAPTPTGEEARPLKRLRDGNWPAPSTVTDLYGTGPPRRPTPSPTTKSDREGGIAGLARYLSGKDGRAACPTREPGRPR